MKQHQIKVGGIYEVKVSGELAAVQITHQIPSGLYGWYGINLATRRTIRIKCAQRLRRPVRLSKWTGDAAAALTWGDDLGWNAKARNALGLTRAGLAFASRINVGATKLRGPTPAESRATEQAIGRAPENSSAPEEGPISDQEVFDDLLDRAGPAIIRLGHLIRVSPIAKAEQALPISRKAMNALFLELSPAQAEALRDLMELAKKLAETEVEAGTSTPCSLGHQGPLGP